MTVCAWKIHGDRAWLSLRHSIFVAFWSGSVFAGSECGQPCRGDEMIAAGHIVVEFVMAASPVAVQGATSGEFNPLFRLAAMVSRKAFASGGSFLATDNTLLVH